MSTIVLTGAEHGLGDEIHRALSRNHSVIPFQDPYNDFSAMDVRSTGDCSLFVKNLKEYYAIEHIDILINCAGINRIDYLEDFREEDWDLVMDTNAKGIFNLTKQLLPLLREEKFNGCQNGGTILNIVSNAAHMPMTSSLAYNASKAAAHIMTLQMARELFPRHGITVFGIAPNKLKGTQMSSYIEERTCKVRGWTPEFAKAYQRKALAIGEETDPAQLADFIRYLIQSKNHHKYFHGTIIPYGA